MATDPKDVYRRFLLELWNVEDPGRLRELAAPLVASDLTIHQRRPGLQTRPARGVEAIAGLIEEGGAPFEDARVEIEVGPLAEGDLVAARWTFTGRDRGGIPGASAPAGTEVRFGGMDIVRVSDGRVAEYWISSDESVFASQMGMGG